MLKVSGINVHLLSKNILDTLVPKVELKIGALMLYVNIPISGEESK